METLQPVCWYNLSVGTKDADLNVILERNRDDETDHVLDKEPDHPETDCHNFK